MRDKYSADFLIVVSASLAHLLFIMFYLRHTIFDAVSPNQMVVANE